MLLMRSLGLLILALLSFIVIHFVLIPIFPVFLLNNLWLVLTLLIVVMQNPYLAVITIALVSLVSDLSTGFSIGAGFISLSLAAMVMYVVYHMLLLRSPFAAPVGVALATIVYGFANVFVSYISGWSNLWFDFLFRWLLPSVVINALLSVPVYLLVKKLSVGGYRKRISSI